MSVVISSRVIWRQFWGRKRGEVDKNNHSGRHYLLANTITIIIIVVVITINIIGITRPKPAYGRQGLAGSLG